MTLPSENISEEPDSQAANEDVFRRPEVRHLAGGEHERGERDDVGVDGPGALVGAHAEVGGDLGTGEQRRWSGKAGGAESQRPGTSKPKPVGHTSGMPRTTALAL